MKEHELNEQGQARRKFLKQAGAVAWASPFIVTMMSRTAHAQPGCGTQDPTELGGCLVTAPCGTTQVCAPDATNLGVGNPCLCVGA